MTKDEALKLALEALEWVVEQAGGPVCEHESGGAVCFCKENKAITSIKEALAQPEQEQCQCPNCRVTLHASDCAVHNEPAYPKGACNCGAQPEQEPVAWEQFYPDIGKPKFVAKPEQVCRDDGRCQYAIDSGAEGMGHCPKGKCVMPAQPEQEPVTWRNAAIRVGEDLCSVGPFGYYDMTAQQWLDWALSVVTVHTQPQPTQVKLTDDEIWKFWCLRPEIPEGENDSMEAEFVAVVRAVLAAHGIKE